MFLEEDERNVKLPAQIAASLNWAEWKQNIHDPLLVRLFGGVLGLLIVASAIGWMMKRGAKTDRARAASRRGSTE